MAERVGSVTREKLDRLPVLYVNVGPRKRPMTVLVLPSSHMFALQRVVRVAQDMLFTRLKTNFIPLFVPHFMPQ